MFVPDGPIDPIFSRTQTHIYIYIHTHTHIQTTNLEVRVAGQAQNEALDQVEGDGEVLEQRGEDDGGQVHPEQGRGPGGDEALCVCMDGWMG